MLHMPRAALIPSLLALATAAPALVVPSVAWGQSKTITSNGPLTQVTAGNDGSCQVAYAGDPALEFYPSGSSPAHCGTFIWSATAGALFAPSVSAGGVGAKTNFTPVSQSDPSGTGAANNPLRIQTVYDAGATGLRVVQTDSYVPGQEVYRTDVQITNSGGAAQSGVIYRAGDCYLQGSDTGYGFVEAANNGPGCSVNANNSPAGRIEQWVPLTAGSSYLHDNYNAVWAAIGTHNPFPNTCKCTELLDNGGGLSWAFNIAPGANVTYSHLTVFSPSGVTGGQQQQPQPQTTPPPQTTTPRLPTGSVSLPLPSNRRCTSRRAFPIRVRKYPGVRYAFAVVYVNGRRVPVYVYLERRARVTRIGAVYLNSTKRFRAFVDLRGLARGTYRVQVRAVTTDARSRTNTRRYRTCSRRLRGTIPRL